LGDYKDKCAGRETRPLVLALTNRSDFTADWLILELNRRDATVVRFNTEDWPTATKLVWHDDGSQVLRIDAEDIDASQITAVWYRRPVRPVMPESLDTDRAHWAEREAVEAIDGFWHTLQARWVNPPLAETAASSKPEQLRRARRHGLLVPETLVTNDPDAARSFAAAGDTVCKPLGHGAIQIDGRERLFFTSLLNSDDIAALSDLGPEPYLLQRLVPKQYDLRVIVIGDDVFAVRIDSQGVEKTRTDWRRGDATQLPHTVVELPQKTADRCLSLMRDYGLVFGAIDLAVDLAGRHVFFELNPSGQWAWLEQLTELPLRSRLADLLIDGHS
jgi:hypothetical protein